MSSISSANPSDLLTSAITAFKAQNANVAENMAQADVRGALRKDLPIVSHGACGVMVGNRTVSLDPGTVKDLQKANGLDAYWTQMSSTYRDFIENFGTKGALSSLDTMCQSIREEVLKLNADISGTQKLTTLLAIKDQLAKFSNIQDKITAMRLEIDQRKDHIVNSEVPALLETLASLNKTDRTADEAQALNTAKFDLAQKLGDLTFEQGQGPESSYFTVKVGYAKLLERQTPADLGYVPTSNPAPGVALSAITRNGTPIDANISSGELGGLNAADKALVNIQSALDELANHLCTTINTLHNQGTGTLQPTTLEGGIGYFGTEGTPLNTADVISGSGTLRIAILDNTHQSRVVDYKDIALQQNETIASLFNRMNTGAYALGSGQTFTVSVTASGIPEITVNNTTNPPVTLGLALGYSGASPAMLCSGPNYIANTATHFSSFFHLNDLIVNSNKAGNIAGTFGNLAVRSDLLSNPDRLSGCVLDNGVPPGTFGVVDRPATARNIFDQLYGSFTQSQNFNQAGDMEAASTTLLDYGASIIDFYARQKITAQDKLDKEKLNLQNLQQKFHNQSEIDVEAEKLKGLQIARSLNAAMSLLKKIMELELKELSLLEM